MRKLSAVIITFNEARNIKRCIASLQGVVDEIVVVDSFSTDATPSICKGLGVNFHQREWKGYSRQKNYGADLASNNWILSIDADEALSTELRDSIIEAKSKEKGENFSFNRLTNYCGQWIKRCGWYPDTKVRLYNRVNDNWQGEVHESLSVNKSTVVKLKGDLLHYSYYNVNEHSIRTTKYAQMGAEELYSKGKRASLIKLIFNPWLKFNKMYFLQLGFLEGVAGLTISFVTAYGTYLKYVNLWNLHKSKS